jgi:hypothetical protein
VRLQRTVPECYSEENINVNSCPVKVTILDSLVVFFIPSKHHRYKVLNPIMDHLRAGQFLPGYFFIVRPTPRRSAIPAMLYSSLLACVRPQKLGLFRFPIPFFRTHSFKPIYGLLAKSLDSRTAERFHLSFYGASSGG